MCTDPEDVVGRIGKKTVVYCEGTLQPSIRDLLPPESSCCASGWGKISKR